MINMKVCLNCGYKDYNEDNNFCIDCGSRLRNIIEKPKSNITKHNQKIKYKTGDYIRDAGIAEELYKVYDKNLISSLDNTDAYLLASQIQKIDVLIEQNSRILDLLENIANKP